VHQTPWLIKQLWVRLTQQFFSSSSDATACFDHTIIIRRQTVVLVCERTIPTMRPPLGGEVEDDFADRGCPVVRATDPQGRALGFIVRSRYYFFRVASQLYSRVRVDPFPGPLLLRKSGSARNRTRYLWICSQELWPLDHRGGQVCPLLSLFKKHLMTLVWYGFKSVYATLISYDDILLILNDIKRCVDGFKPISYDITRATGCKHPRLNLMTLFAVQIVNLIKE
jgi:hypothetical protein